ncbi:helix-turn-helix transcriptional regulator [Litoribacillus peritrichatus]
MNKTEKNWLLRKLKEKIKEAGLTQKEIAKELDLDQGRISRLINGNFARWGGDIKRLCNRFGVDLNLISQVDSSSNTTLINALNRNWDGTQEHALLIANVIDDVCALTERQKLT